MGQEEIVSFLRENKGRWFNVSQLSLALNIPKVNVGACIKRMRKYDELNEKSVRLRFQRNVSRDVLHFSFKN
jgi:hypothetical protein